jgi:GNAT superfamily N-acetyltransferase
MSLSARPIEDEDDTSRFSSGEPSIDMYLKQYARQSQGRGGPVDEERYVIAYYSLVADALEPDEAPRALTKGMGRYRIPMTLLARLGVDERYHGKGIGRDLVIHAFATAVAAAGGVGSRGILVQPINEGLYRYYEQFGFKKLDPDTPLDQLKPMYVLMNDVRATLETFG